MQLIVGYLGAAATFLVLDLVWLGFVAYDLYRREMGNLIAPQFNMTAATAFYVLFIVGVVIFAIQPALAEGGLRRAVVLGALFGFFAYATYDLTCLAVIKAYPLKIALIDMAWGTLLTASAAGVGAAAASRF